MNNFSYPPVRALVDPVNGLEWLHAFKTSELALGWAEVMTVMLVDGRMYHWQPGRVFLFHPRQRRIVDGPLSSLKLICFPEWLLRQFLSEHPEAMGLSLFQPVGGGFFIDLPAEVMVAIDALYQLMSASPEALWRLMDDYLWIIFRHILQAARLSSELSKEVMTAIGMLYKLIRLHYREERSALFYADKLGEPVRQLNRMARQSTGRNIVELVNEQLLAEGQQLLVYSDAQVKRIAADLGFNSTAVFSTFFRRAVGMGPLAFRKRFRV